MVRSGVMLITILDTVTVRALINVNQLSFQGKPGHITPVQLRLCIIVTVGIVKVDEQTIIVALEIMPDHESPQYATPTPEQKELIRNQSNQQANTSTGDNFNYL